MPNSSNGNVVQCTTATCPLDSSWLSYAPNLPGNAFFVALFGVILFLQIGLGIRYKTWGFLAGMFGGMLLELLGYVGRIQLHSAPFDRNAFLLYLICVTIAPAFISASIYLGLARIVVIYGETISRVKPATYTFLFIGCDLFSLVLQSIGGGMAAQATEHTAEQNGVHIMAAGLAFQVASLVLFIILCGEFAFRVSRRKGALDPMHARLRTTWKFKAFLFSLAIATVCILTRSAFRVAELSQGFGGKLAHQQITYMILDATMVGIASILLTAFHPGVSFQGSWNTANFHLGRKKRRNGEVEKGSGITTP